ncbi:MAG: BON domain-containing protein [Chitinophagaceae bacterium]|nr:MAG: BON domain-containing protein [Chitinophagaceae bacterium]
MSYVPVVLICLALLLMSCSQHTIDREIKSDIATKAKSETCFAGINYIVANGRVHLSGTYPTDACRQKIISKIQGIAGVSEIDNRMVPGEVVLNQDYELKLRLDSVLSRYPSVMAQLSGNNIYLRGNLPSAEAKKLID